MRQSIRKQDSCKWATNAGGQEKVYMAAGYVLIIAIIFAGELWIKNRVEEAGGNNGERAGKTRRPAGKAGERAGKTRRPAGKAGERAGKNGRPAEETGEQTEKRGEQGRKRFLPESFFRGKILIRKYHNKGAMLNLGQNRSQLVAAASVALSIMLTVLFVISLGQRGNRLLRTGLAFLLGGAFSNTYDRLKRRYVVDYFSFQVQWKPLRRVVFNLSDFCIMIGAMLTALGME